MAVTSRQGELRTALLGALLVLALAGAQTVLNATLSRLGSEAIQPPFEELRKIDPELFKALTFGHWPSAVDGLWMKVLQDDELSHVPRGTHPSTYFDLELATDLDPAFYEAYVSGGNQLVVIRDDALGARDLLLKGERFRSSELSGYPAAFRHENWSKEWQLPALLAYVYLFELNDLVAARRAFGEASRLPGAPVYLERLERRFGAPGGLYEVGLRLVNALLVGEERPLIIQELEKKREALKFHLFLFHVRESFRSFLAAWKGPSPEPRKRWREFLNKTGGSETDPWGGHLSLSDQGEVVSTTSFAGVFGLSQ